MRILLLNQAFHPDVVSSAQHAADLAAHLAAEGHQVSVVAGSRGYDNPAETFQRREIWKGVTIHRVAAGRLGKGARWKRYADFGLFLLCLAGRLLTLPRFDVVIAMTTPPLIGFLGALFVRFKGGRLIYWLMDLNPDQAIAAGCLRAGSPIARVLGRMLAFTLRTASKTVVLDRFMQARVLEKGAPAESVEIIPPWSHNLAISHEYGPEAFRKEHGLAGKFVIMYSGNHSPCHPLDDVLAAALLLQAHTDIQFVFVGGGSEKAKIGAFARSRGLRNVTLIPYQPRARLAASLGAADLHVVAMGDPFVGIVHPCKIYNVLSLGISVLYIGPEKGHIPDIGSGAGEWFHAARNGDADAIAGHILAQAARLALRDPREMAIARRFTADRLIARMTDAIESSGAAGLQSVRFSEIRMG